MRSSQVTQITPFFLDLTEAEIAAIQAEMGNVLRSGQLILGKHTEAFEAEFARYAGTRHAVSLNTADSALEVLCVLKGANGRKVAVPSNTHFGSVEAIVRAGGQPVFMDMTEKYFAPDLRILKETNARHGVGGVMWVHIGGLIAPDFMEVAEYCRSAGLFLIEDCTHAHGSRMHGLSAGAFGDGGAFSFFPTKVMTTMEGGMIVTNSAEDAALAKSLRNQGRRHAANCGLHHDHGSSWRISEIAAFMGLVQLTKLDRMVATRQAAADLVTSRLRQAGIGWCETDHMDTASQYKLIVRLPAGIAADAAKQALSAEGVICGAGVYETPCHRQPVFAGIPFRDEDLAVTDARCPRHVCPPITSGTSIAHANRIAEALVKVLS